MRQMSLVQILTCILLLTLAVALGIGTTWLTLGSLPLGDFRGVTLVGASIVAVYSFAIATYRIFLLITPLKEGDIPEGSREEFVAQVYFLFYLLLFNSLIRTHFLPVPLMRLIYLALGARMGSNSYSAGALLDPPLTIIGDNCIIGHDAALFSHALEGRHLSFATIRIGDNVTIGATAVIMPGVTVGDGAIVSAGAIVNKGTQIGAGEIWGGIPARLIKGAAS